MTLYCVMKPWNAYYLPEDYPDLFRWFGSLTKAKRFAREQASDLEWDSSTDHEVLVDGEFYQGVVVTKVVLPRLSTKKLVLWMSRWACSPRGTVVYVAKIEEEEE